MRTSVRGHRYKRLARGKDAVGRMQAAVVLTSAGVRVAQRAHLQVSDAHDAVFGSRATSAHVPADLRPSAEPATMPRSGPRSPAKAAGPRRVGFGVARSPWAAGRPSGGGIKGAMTERREKRWRAAIRAEQVGRHGVDHPSLLQLARRRVILRAHAIVVARLLRVARRLDASSPEDGALRARRRAPGTVLPHE